MKKKAMTLFGVLMLSFTFASVVGAGYQDDTPKNTEGANVNYNACVKAGLCQRP